MGKVSKATKKFQKNHLKDTLTKRKETKSARKWIDKNQQKQQRKAIKERVSSMQQRDGQSSSSSKLSTAGPVKAAAPEMNWRELDTEAFINEDEEEDAASISEDGIEEEEDVLQGFDLSDLEKDVLAASDDEATISGENDDDEEEELDGSDVDMEDDDGDDMLASLIRQEAANDGISADDDDDEDDEDDTEGDDDEIEEEGDEEEEDDDAILGVDSDGEREDAAEESKVKVTVQMVAAWQRALLESGSPKALRHMLLAFRAASQYYSSSSAVELSRSQKTPYTIPTARVFEAVLVGTSKSMLHCRALLLGGSSASVRPQHVTLHAAWASTWQPLCKSFAATLPYLLQMIDAASDAQLLQSFLKTLPQLLPLVTPFPRHTKLLIKALLGIWAISPSNTTHKAKQSTRLVPLHELAFLNLHTLLQLEIKADDSEGNVPPVVANVLKSSYLTFISTAKTCNGYNLSHLEWMCRSLQELYVWNVSAGYLHAFVYLRMLAIQLRNAMREQTRGRLSSSSSSSTAATTNGGKQEGKTIKKELVAVKGVQSWAVVWSVRLWGSVLACVGKNVTSEKPGVTMMRTLIYPYVQIVLGMLGLHTTSQTLPFRLHLLEALVQLGAVTRTYIPLYASFHSILSSLLFFQNSKASMEKTLEMELLLRIAPKQLGTRAAYDAAFPMVKYLLVAWMAPWWNNIGFPEMTLSVTVHLRKLSKSCKNVKTSKWLKEIIDRTEQTASMCRAQRDKVSFTPANLAQCRAWEAAGWGCQQSINAVPITVLLMQYKKEKDARKQALKEQYTRETSTATAEKTAAASASKSRRPSQTEQKKVPKSSKGVTKKMVGKKLNNKKSRV